MVKYVKWKGIRMDHFRTQYEKCYEGDTYYWGLEPAAFLDELLEKIGKPASELSVLDIGCGEGKDAVYMAQQGCKVTAFDITESGIRKTKVLAAARNVPIHAFVADINDFEMDDQFDIIYSTGTIQYLFEQNKDSFFRKVRKMTKAGGLVFFNVFVEKPFLELPPDWDVEEKMWKTGELFCHFTDWKILDMKERIFEDESGGIPHYHCMDTIIAERMK